MFTGLIQSTGKIRHHAASFLIDGYESFDQLVIGDSVAVDGVCLTVKEFLLKGFLVDVSEETSVSYTHLRAHET